MKMQYKYGGARALVELHEHHLRDFLESWKAAKATGVALPDTSDPDYNSLQHVLRHVLGAAGGYLNWVCQQLELPDPLIEPVPELEGIESTAADYLEHVLDRWRGPLSSVTEEQCYRPEYESSWTTRYSIDSMLEHAVMHPVRHSHQLRQLMA